MVAATVLHHPGELEPCTIPPVDVHVPAERLRRPELSAAEAARVGSRWPDAAPETPCRVLGEGALFPRLVVGGRAATAAANGDVRRAEDSRRRLICTQLSPRYHPVIRWIHEMTLASRVLTTSVLGCQKGWEVLDGEVIKRNRI
jgi:hypothetical protein